MDEDQNISFTSPSPFPPLNATPTTGFGNDSVVGNNASTIMGAIIMSLAFLLGVPGNLFIIWSILVRARKRSITTLLILNLACADGFLMALTVFFIVYLAKQNWVFGNAMCKVVFYLCNVNMYASIHLITLMSLYRLVAVVFPHRLGAVAGRKTALRVLIGFWILVFALAVPAVVFREDQVKQDKSGRKSTVCATHHSQPQYVIFQYTFETVVGFLLPYGVIVGSYVCILRRLRETRFRRRVRSENLILAVVVVFALFWLPYYIINVVQVAAELNQNLIVKKRLETIWQSSRTVTSSLAFVSSCANPVLYTFAAKSYIRQNGMSFMARLFEGLVQDSGTKKAISQCREGRPLKELSNSAAGNEVKNGPLEL